MILIKKIFFQYKYSSNQKTSSGDESKENKPEMNDVGVNGDTENRISEEQDKRKSDKDLSVPLSVKCDQEQVLTSPAKPEQSRSCSSKSLSETLSPAIWPTFAELFDDAPQIDEELDDQQDQQQGQCHVTIDEKELEKVLTQAVNVTRGCSVLALMDLYGQLNRVVMKYAKTTDRNSLPQELCREITRFQDIQKRPHSSVNRCPTPAS